MSTELVLDFDAEYASPGRVRQHLARLPAWLERLAHGLTERFSLAFAGHTHGGQIRLPGLGALVTNCDLPRPFASGMHHWNSPEGAETTLEISAGLGTSIYAPVRVFCPPEAVLLTLTASTRTG